jgi:hypothetical protein
MMIYIRQQTENLFISASPRDPWVQLQPQRKDGINKDDIKVYSEKSVITLSSNSDDISVMLGDCKISEVNKKVSCFNGNTCLKLHNLCSSSSSIEMIRIYTSTYPWIKKQKDPNGDIPLHVAIKRDDPSLVVIYELACSETARIRDR